MPHQNIFIKGKRYPSVTEVIGILRKEFLEFWRGKIGNHEADRISKESAELGRHVHELIEQYLKEGSIWNVEKTYTKEEINLFNVWYEWWETTNYNNLKIEKTLISKKLKCCGTPDLLTEDTVIDWKISNNDDKYRPLQLAGYAKLYFDETKIKLNKGLIVRIDKYGKLHIKKVKDLWKWVPMFIMLRKLYDMVNGLGKWQRKLKRK